VNVKNLVEGGARLTFEDGETIIADLVIGADGIRSAVKQSLHPDHKISWNGKTLFLHLLY
jgi:salicylate hydroxylase